MSDDNRNPKLTRPMTNAECRMSKRALLACVLLSSFVIRHPSFAATPPLITEARQAIAEDIPEVAIEKLRRALALLPVGDEDRTAALALLAEAQLDTGRADAALDTLAQITPGDDARTVRLRALSLMALGRWDEALVQFQKLAARDTEKLAAFVGKAECLQSLGRTQEAADVLRPLATSKTAQAALRLRFASLLVDFGSVAEARALLDSTPRSPADENWRRYIQARIHLHEKKPLAALDDLAPFIPAADAAPPAGVSQNLRAAAALAEADARLTASGPETAEKVLESFIRQNPASPEAATVFRRLDQIYEGDRSTDEGPLTRMAAELPPQAAALAQFYLARIHQRAKRTEAADAALKKFLAQFPEHSLAPYAHATLAENAQARHDLAGAEAEFDAASRTAQTEKLRGVIALKTALLNLEQGEFVRASAGFLNAAARSPALKISARYDSALAWLLQKNYARFAEEFVTFTVEFPDATLAGNLRLEEGLTRAREGDVNARATLNTFLTGFKAHPRRDLFDEPAMLDQMLGCDRHFSAQQILIRARPLVTAKPPAHARPFDRRQPRDLLQRAEPFRVRVDQRLAPQERRPCRLDRRRCLRGGGLDLQQQEFTQRRANAARERTCVLAFADQILQHSRDLRRHRQPPHRPRRDAAATQPRPDRAPGQRHKIFDHRIAWVRPQFAVGIRRVGEDRPRPQFMLPTIELHPPPARHHTLQAVKRKMPPRQRVVGVAVLTATHDPRQTRRLAGREVKEKIPSARDLPGKQRRRFIGANFIHVYAGSIHFLRCVSSAISQAALRRFSLASQFSSPLPPCLKSRN